MSKLSSTILSLSSKDKKSFSRFVSSPYHNSKPVLVNLWKALKNNPDASNETLYQQIYPRQIYDDLKLRHAKSELLKLVEDFFLIELMLNSKIDKEVYLLKAFRQRNVPALFEYQQGAIIKKGVLSSLSTNSLYQNYIRLSLANSKNSKEDHFQADLQLVDRSLDSFFLASKLKLFLRRKVHEMLGGEKFEFTMGNTIIESAELERETNPVINIYYTIFCLFQNNNEEYFEEVLELIDDVALYFDKEELLEIYLLLINFYTHFHSKGKDEVASYLSTLYDRGLQSDVFITNEKIAQNTFNTLVSSAIQFREYGWAEKFIQDFGSKLDVKDPSGMSDFHQLLLHYHKGDLNSAKRVISESHIEDPGIRLDMKTMELRIFFETGDYKKLRSMIESFKLTLKREIVPDYEKTAYENFIKVIKKLLTLDRADENAVAAFSKLAKSSDRMVARDWFLKISSDGSKAIA